MTIQELNKRVKQVFDFLDNETIEYVDILPNGDTTIVYRDAENVLGDYRPNMTERPSALNYILGLSNEFSD